MSNSSFKHEVIDLDSNQGSTPLEIHGTHYFGSYQLHLAPDNQLKIVFKFKHDLVSPQLEEQDIAPIGIEEYQMSKIEMNLTTEELTSSLRQAFGNVGNLAVFLSKHIASPELVTIDKEKLTLRKGGSAPVCLYFNNYKKYDKSELLKQMQRFEEVTSEHQTWNNIDQEVLDKILNEEELLEMALDDQQDSSEPENSDQEDKSSSNHSPQGYVLTNLEHQDNYQPPPSETQNYISPTINYQIFKQNQVPIYERFRHVNIHCSRKEKMRLSEQMLRIGYPKEDIIKFFSGGAEEMEAEAKRIPDYRNPQTERYKEIHMIVAKKQHKRHNELLKKHGMLPVPELPQYSGEIIPTIREEVFAEKKIKQVLIRLIKGKKFKRLDQIHLQMRRNGIDTTLPYLKKLVEDMKQKSQQRRKSKAGSEIKQAKQINLDD